MCLTRMPSSSTFFNQSITSLFNPCSTMIRQPGQAFPTRIQNKLCSRIGRPSVGITIEISSNMGLGANSIVGMELDDVHSGFVLVLFKDLTSPKKHIYSS